MESVDSPERERLNALLEDERASVEIEVALINSATEYSERDTFASMGAQEVGFCVSLRERLERQSVPVTPRVNGVVLDVLNIEHYDERLTAFADHQMQIAENIPNILAAASDAELHALLRDIEDAHLQSAAWSRRRASDFAATRLLVFRGHNDPTYLDTSNPTGAANGSHTPTLPDA